MKRSLPLTVLALLAAACSTTFSTSVGTFDTPIANSLGHVCWVEVDATGAPAIRTATFHADATYDPGALAVTERVELQVFGRADAPGADCTARDEERDVPLSEPFELQRETSQRIEVGGEAFGGELAELVRRGRFWLGASAAGNVSLSEQTVTFENGRITVGF